MSHRLVRTGLRIALHAALWSMGVATLLFVSALWFVTSRFDGQYDLPADCAIVFGTAVRPLFDEHGEIVYTGAGPGILRRVSAAADLYRAGSVKMVFLSGGKGEGMAESEASVMQRMAVVKGIPPEDIVVEERSRSTMQNLEYTLPLMRDCTRIVGVSDRYHLARIEILARKAGRPIGTYPAAPTAGAAFEMRSVIREAFGIMLIVLQGLLT